MRFVICKRVNDLNILLLDQEGNLIMFDNEVDAEIERIYQQPDYEERLIVYPSRLGE